LGGCLGPYIEYEIVRSNVADGFCLRDSFSRKLFGGYNVDRNRYCGTVIFVRRQCVCYIDHIGFVK
jgi:hypothetical protein